LVKIDHDDPIESYLKKQGPNLDKEELEDQFDTILQIQGL